MPVVPRIIIHTRRGIRNPYLPVSAIRQRGHIFHDTGHAIGRMTEEKFTSLHIGRTEKAARYTFRKYGRRLSGVEYGFIVGLSIDKGEVKHTPEDVVRLPQIHADRRLARQRNRCRYRENGINSDSFRCFQRLETFAGGLHTHRSVARPFAPVRVGDAHRLDVQKAVAIAFGRERSHLYLLHHYHQHNQEDGKRCTCYTDRTHQRLLAKLRPRLCKILLYHLFIRYFNSTL